MVRELRRFVTRALLARVGAAGACATLLCGAAGPALARDGDEPRGYLAIRGFDTNPITGVRDYWGVSLGGNYNRYLGGELSLDSFERRIKVDSFGSVGEYGITALVPQIRLRYPHGAGGNGGRRHRVLPRRCGRGRRRGQVPVLGQPGRADRRRLPFQFDQLALGRVRAAPVLPRAAGGATERGA